MRPLGALQDLPAAVSSPGRAMAHARRLLAKAVACDTYVCIACDGDRHAIFPAVVLPYYLGRVGWMGGEGGPNASIYDSSAKIGAMARARRLLAKAVACDTYVCVACDGDRHAIFPALVLR